MPELPKNWSSGPIARSRLASMVRPSVSSRERPGPSTAVRWTRCWPGSWTRSTFQNPRAKTNSLIIACQRALSGDISPDELLSIAAQVVIDSIYARRFGGWVELVEDASIMAYGGGPYLVAGLTLQNLPEHILEAAKRTHEELRPPAWLPAYLALDDDTEPLS